MDGRGWNDIGYGYLVDRDGIVYEGRGEHIAAHSPGRNHEPSVSMIGTYATVDPSDAMHAAVYELRDYLYAGNLRGHRENTFTSCPGDAGYAKVVLGPPPSGVDADFYFEEMSHIEGGRGPVIVWHGTGTTAIAVATNRLLGRKVSTVRDANGVGWVLWWLDGTYKDGLPIYGPWKDKSDRDGAMVRYADGTGRVLRPFMGRPMSRYPIAK